MVMKATDTQYAKAIREILLPKLTNFRACT